MSGFAIVGYVNAIRDGTAEATKSLKSTSGQIQDGRRSPNLCNV